jgi:hypothetical protein
LAKNYFQESRRRGADQVNYAVSVESNRLLIVRNGENSPIVDLDLAGMVYEDQHISLAFNVGPKALLYGLGEHLTKKYGIPCTNV